MKLTSTINAYPSFESATEEVLSFLSSRLNFGLWMVTRTESDDWIVLDARDSIYGVKPGDVFRWTDSFCSRLVEGQVRESRRAARKSRRSRRL